MTTKAERSKLRHDVVYSRRPSMPPDVSVSTLLSLLDEADELERLKEDMRRTQLAKDFSDIAAGDTPMTDISQMEAGPQLDTLVAKAIGMEVANSFREGWGFAREGGPFIPCYNFEPSRTWNAAMLAAEEFGLFCPPDRAWPVLGKSGTLWAVYNCTSMEEISTPIADADTGPLAVSRAIAILHAQGAGK